MTSIPPAQPRPSPAPSNTASGPLLARKSSYSLQELDQERTLEDETTTIELTDIDERPLKRRKIYIDSSIPSHGKDIPSILVADDGDDDAEPVKPKKRYLAARWASTTPIARRPNDKDERENAPDAVPLPVPPWGSDNPPQKIALPVRTSCRIRANVPVPNKPETISTPEHVPKLEHKRPADFFPWTGKHPEDVLNEVNVKSGYNDRAPNPPEKELNTARNPLYSAFKQRYGLESLSAMFQMLLERKAKSETLSSSTSFKPPPRVTLTEAKRKSWIADLADINVPLRRLSRTIPQGIRGQGLLDQCAISRVPLARAIWFIKCVGANEIRTLKRKGTTPNMVAGVELKWLREWTVNVEQFIESCIAQAGQPNWEQNLQYALRICTRLYLDNLMDRDHYLDWIVKTLHSSPITHFSFWLMMVNLHSPDIVRFRKRAQTLSQALISRFENLQGAQPEMTPVLARLRRAIRDLAMSRPAAFVAIEACDKIMPCLEMCLDRSDRAEDQVMEHIKTRNARFAASLDTSDATVSGQTKAISLLDSVQAPYNLANLSAAIVDAAGSVAFALRTCLQWAVSKFRVRDDLIYLVARLIRFWDKTGYDLGSELLAFFLAKHDLGRRSSRKLRWIFAELCRSEIISPSRFLQQFSIRGLPKKNGLSQHPDLPNLERELTETCDELLTDMCTETLEAHNLNLRNALLNRARYDLTAEAELRDKGLEMLSNAVNNGASLDQTLLHALGACNWSVKFTISRWVRSNAVEFAEHFELELPEKPPLPGMKGLTPNIFHVFRTVLEVLGDTAALADVLEILSKTQQDAVLASLVDTVHVHAKELVALGAFDSLQSNFCQSYVVLRSQRPSLLHFALSLLDLCRSYPNSTTPVRALEHDIVKGDRGRAVTAYSPFSDGVAESLQQAGETFVDDFEAILLAENNMADVTMTSLFSVLIGRIMKGDGEHIPGQSTSELCLLLSRLRLLKRTQADILVKKWLNRILSSPWSPGRAKVLQELLLTRITDFDDLFEIANLSTSHASCKTAIYSILTNNLQPCRDKVEENAYAIVIAGQRFSKARVLDTINVVLSDSARTSMRDDMIMRLLVDLFLDRKAGQVPTAMDNALLPYVDSLLNMRSTDAQSPIQSTFARLDPFSVPFCQYRLRHIADGAENDDAMKSENEVVEAVSTVMLSHTAEDRERLKFLQPLLHCLETSTTDKLRDVMEEAFLVTLPKINQNKSLVVTTPLSGEARKRLTESAENVLCLGPAQSYNENSTVLASLVEKLAQFGKLLGAKPDGSTTGQMTTGSMASPIVTTVASASTPMTTNPAGMDSSFSETRPTVLEYIWVLLLVTSTKCAIFGNTCTGTSTNNAKQRQNEQLKLVALITMIATQPSLGQWQMSDEDEEVKQHVGRIVTFALDIAGRLVDDMSDECRTMCAKMLKDRMKDGRVQWLLGSVNLVGSVQGTEAGRGMQMMHESRGNMGDFRLKNWDILESGGGKESDTCLGLGLFGAKKA